MLPEIRESIESAVIMLRYTSQWAAKAALEILDEGCDVEGLHVGELVHSARRTIARNGGGVEIGPACVVVVDLRRED